MPTLTHTAKAASPTPFFTLPCDEGEAPVSASTPVPDPTPVHAWVLHPTHVTVSFSEPVYFVLLSYTSFCHFMGTNYQEGINAQTKSLFVSFHGHNEPSESQKNTHLTWRLMSLHCFH